MAITDEGSMLAARANNRQSFSIMKASIANAVAGQMFSGYRSTGPMPSQPAIPGIAAICTDALTWPFNNPTAPDKTFLDVMDCMCTVAGGVMWYDRLFHMGGLSGTVTTAQAVNSGSVLTFPFRGSNITDVEWFLEWYTDTGSTAVTATVTGLYSDDSAMSVAVSLAATMRAGRLLPIIPATGKVIKSITSVTLSATTGTAGSFGVTCGDRMSGSSMFFTNANAGHSREAILKEVADDTCFWPVFNCSTTSTGDLRGEFVLIQG